MSGYSEEKREVKLIKSLHIDRSKYIYTLKSKMLHNFKKLLQNFPSLNKLDNHVITNVLQPPPRTDPSTNKNWTSTLQGLAHFASAEICFKKNSSI